MLPTPPTITGAGASEPLAEDEGASITGAGESKPLVEDDAADTVLGESKAHVEDEDVSITGAGESKPHVEDDDVVITSVGESTLDDDVLETALLKVDVDADMATPGALCLHHVPLQQVVLRLPTSDDLRLTSYCLLASYDHCTYATGGGRETNLRSKSTKKLAKGADVERSTKKGKAVAKDTETQLTPHMKRRRQQQEFSAEKKAKKKHPKKRRSSPRKVRKSISVADAAAEETPAKKASNPTPVAGAAPGVKVQATTQKVRKKPAGKAGTDEGFADLIRSLPAEARPPTPTHTKQSYIVQRGLCKIQVLLKERAFFLRTRVSGEKSGNGTVRHFGFGPRCTQTPKDAWEAALRAGAENVT